MGKNKDEGKKSGRKSDRYFIISLIFGLVIFVFFIYWMGLDAFHLILENINFFYLILYFILSLSFFIFSTLRWQVIVNAYKSKNISFFKLLKQTFAGYSLSYATPSARLGGEPLRVYMLNKECGVSLKNASSSVIMDKFVELAGTVFLGILGLIIIVLMIPAVSFLFNLILVFVLLIAIIFLSFIYHRTIIGKGSFSSFFNLFNFKSKKYNKFVQFVFVVERKMEDFFKHHKMRFFIAFLLYFIYFIFLIIEIKVLFLSFGVDASILTVFITIIVLGIVNFIPVPGGLGFLEAGQASLFKILQGEGEVGMALSLLLRLRALFFVAIGFSIVSHFSGKQIKKKIKD